jgi:hypothetical protein
MSTIQGHLRVYSSPGAVDIPYLLAVLADKPNLENITPFLCQLDLRNILHVWFHIHRKRPHEGKKMESAGKREEKGVMMILRNKEMIQGAVYIERKTKEKRVDCMHLYLISPSRKGLYGFFKNTKVTLYSCINFYDVV